MRRQLTTDEQDALYRGIGCCIWHIQSLEDVLHTYLALKIEIRQPARIQEEEARDLLAKHRRATLGTALKTAERHTVFHPELLAALIDLKEERDWLVHRSMHQDGNSLYTKEGRKSFFVRLDAIMEKTMELKGNVFTEVAAFCKSHGVSSQQAEKLAREQFAILRGNA